MEIVKDKTMHFLKGEEYMQRKVSVVILLLLIFTISLAFAEEKKYPPDEFFNVFEKPEHNTIGSGIVENQDGYIIAGSIFDESSAGSWGWVVKIDKAGKKQWEKELGKKARDSAFYGVTTTDDNSIVLAGNVNAIPSGTFEKSTGWVVKLKSDGKVEWDKTLQFERIAYAIDVKSIKGKDVIVVGRVRRGTWDSPSIENSAFITAIDSKGRILWSKHIQKGYWADIVYPSGKEGFIIGSGSWISKIDNTGKILWEYYLGKKGEYNLSALKELEDGSIIVGGVSKDKKIHHALLSKLRIDGKLEWNKKIETSGFCSVSGLWTTKSNEIIAVGGTCSKEQEQIWAATFSESGEIKKIKKFLSSKNLIIHRAIPISNDGFIAVGDGAKDGSAAWVFKTKF